MIIIAEGMDNTGKTFLCNELKRMRPWAHLEKLRTEGSVPTRPEIAAFCDDLILRAEQRIDTVFDRHSIVSELVYGSVLRPEPLLSWAEVANILGMVADYCNIVLIYCRPPDERVLDFGEREQMPGVRENARRLLATYDDVIRHYRNYFSGALRRMAVYDYVIDPTAATLLAELRNGGLW